MEGGGVRGWLIAVLHLGSPDGEIAGAENGGSYNVHTPCLGKGGGCGSAGLWGSWRKGEVIDGRVEGMGRSG